MAQADAGQVPLLTPATSASPPSPSCRAIPDHYLYVARELSAMVLAAIARTEQGVDRVRTLRARAAA